MYEVQENNISNMAMSNPGSMRNKGYTDMEENHEQWTEIDIDDTQESDNTETSNCMSTILNQGAQSSVRFLRKSLNCLLKQDENQDVCIDHKNHTQKTTTHKVADHKKELEPMLEERLVSLRWLTTTLNILKLKKYVEAHRILKK